MPRTKKTRVEATGAATISDKLVAQLLCHFLDADYTQRGKIALLSRCGLAHDDIAAVLGTSSATVKQSVYEVKSGKGGLRKDGDDARSSGRKAKRK